MNKKERMALAYYARSAKSESRSQAEKDEHGSKHPYPYMAGVMEVNLQTIADALESDKCPKWIVIRYENYLEKINKVLNDGSNIY